MSLTDEQRSMLDALMDVEEGLTPWEIDFIDRIDRIEAFSLNPLSDKQADKFEEIYKRLCREDNHER